MVKRRSAPPTVEVRQVLPRRHGSHKRNSRFVKSDLRSQGHAMVENISARVCVDYS
jgi:hypothetical protein